MSENKKVLGIFLAKMQDRIRTEYLNAINRAAGLIGWKTVAYNSFRDFRKNDLSLQGSKSIYKVMDYDRMDAVIIFPESINNSEISDSLIESAKVAGKPVISVGPEKEGCFSIIRDYEDAYKKMLNHVINEHGARDLFFVSGFKYDDERSVNRLRLFKEVLAENGIKFDDKRMCYGYYKDEVISQEMDKLLSGSNIPKAIVCIDDKAAITVCDKLSEYDLKSPEDVIVTGFGGIPAAYYYHPSITTCSDDVDTFAELILQAARDAMDGKKPKIYRNPFKFRIRRSCGCDMRSYMSAGRRSYDLNAAKAAGIYVPDGVIPASEGTEETKQDETQETAFPKHKIEIHLPGYQNETPDDTVFMPDAAREGTVILYKKKDDPENCEPKAGTYDVTYGGRSGENLSDDKADVQRAVENMQEPCLARITEIPVSRDVQEKPVKEMDLAAQRAFDVADDKKCAAAHSEKRFRSGNHVAYIYKELDEIERREDSALAWLDRMLEFENISDICEEISLRIPSNSVLYLYSELLESNFDVEGFSKKHSKQNGGDDYKTFRNMKVTRIISSEDKYPSKKAVQDEVKVQDMITGYLESPDSGTILVMNPIFIGDFVCGYYAVCTSAVSDIRSNTKLLNMGLNMIFRFMANKNQQQRMLYNIENSVYVSSMTGLPNLKGSTRWFEGFSNEQDNHKKSLSVSVFSMPRYTYIYENYGLYEVEEAVRLVVEKIRQACRKSSFIGQFAEGEYIVIDFENEQSGGKLTFADEIYKVFSRELDEYNRGSTKEYYLEVNFGTATLEEGWNATLENLVRMAMSDMYLRRLRQGKATPVIKDKTFDREYFTTFELLVDRNLFRYHFQPIVEAATGNIFAYEALMRTGGGISMSPLDVLEIAKNANRLYDIEKATVFNVLQFYVDNLEKFNGRKIFINTIPGYYLTDEDREEAIARFGQYFDYVVFEVTETDTVTDDELEKLRCSSPEGHTPSVAVDDYGTGHSNIVNLIRYSPQIIKIDHYLISNIQDDSNKQMFVKNTIEFAAMNGMKVLAEGVETYDELKTVIEYGVDYIQGYYTARPEAEIMQHIPNNIRNEILAESIKAAQFDSDNLVYNAKAGETVNLLDLTLKKYTTINVLGGKVKIVGEPDNVIDMVVRTADNKKTDLTFENVNLRGVLETTVQLGRNSEIALCIMGECTLNKDGIYVPANSRLTVSGDGNLHIITSRNLSVGIGSNCNEPHGDISFDMTGSVKIVANGDKAVGIGGGRCDGSRIRLINGNFDISAKAIHAVAIGSDIGDTDIYIGRTVHCRLKSDGNDSVALGSISGKSEIVCRGKLDITGDGEKTVGIGSLNGFTKTDLLSNDISVVLHSYCGMCIGSLMGTSEIKLEDTNTDIYAEGTQINGIGGGENAGNVDMSGGNLNIEILAGVPRSFGAQKGYFVLHYGSITCLHDIDVSVLNEHHEQIKPRRIDNGVVFEV